MINYHNKKFRPIQNNAFGEVNSQTVFTYYQQNEIITGIYSGGEILRGQLIALKNEQGALDMRYHHINSRGEIKTGICFSKPELLPSGKLRMHEKWQWTSNDYSEGSSLLEEL